jgi:hypothetical protein
MAEMNRFSWSALFGCSLGAIRARRGWEPQNLNRRWRGAAPRQLFKNTAEMRRLCRCLSALLLLALALPVSLPGQRNPAAAALRDYGGLLPPSGHAALEAKALEVEAARGWKVVPSTYTSAIPQIGENFGGWLAGQTGTVLFYLPAGFEGGLPYIGVSPDLEGVLPAAARQDIVHQAMLAPYQRLDGEGALLAGMEALLTDRAVLAEVAFEGGYPIEGASIPQWRAEAGGEGAASSPLCYRRQDVMRLAPAFARIGAVPTSGLKIKAAADGQEYVIDGELGAGNIIRPADSQRIEIGTGDAVDYWPDFQVDWALSFDGGASWEAAGRSVSKVYVTYAEPTIAYDYFGGLDERILYYGCERGRGSVTKHDLFLKLWSRFDISQGGLAPGHFIEGGDMTKRLSYYRVNDMPNPTKEALLSGDYDGQCTSWTDLLVSLLMYQGFAKTAQGEFQTLIFEAANDEIESMVIKNWYFSTSSTGEYLGTSGLIYSHRNLSPFYPFQAELNHLGEPTGHYVWAVKEAWSLLGIPAQGNSNPVSCFDYHALIKVNIEHPEIAMYYDPSYGVKFQSDEELKGVVDGLYIQTDEWEAVLGDDGQWKAGYKVLFKNDFEMDDLRIRLTTN